LTAPKKIFFASDFHLGVPNYKESLEREKKIVRWLNHIEPEAAEIFLVGLPQELGVELYRDPIEREFFGKKVFIGHGDGLGPGDKGYKFLKKIFRNRFCQWAFARLHPNFGIWLANKSSKTSRAATGMKDEKFHGKENEWLYLFCEEELKKKQVDLFIFGHRHLPIDIPVGQNSRYINLGDWLNYSTFLEIGPDHVALKSWDGNEAKTFHFKE